jgi:hypothetical protein
MGGRGAGAGVEEEVRGRGGKEANLGTEASPESRPRSTYVTLWNVHAVLGLCWLTTLTVAGVCRGKACVHCKKRLGVLVFRPHQLP